LKFFYLNWGQGVGYIRGRC